MKFNFHSFARLQRFPIVKILDLHVQCFRRRLLNPEQNGTERDVTLRNFPVVTIKFRFRVRDMKLMFLGLGSGTVWL